MLNSAIVYQQGTSEQFVGRALKDFAKRDEVFVATKFVPRSPEEIENKISGQKHIENFIDKSLKNLGMELVGVMAQNKPDSKKDLQVWIKNAKNV